MAPRVNQPGSDSSVAQDLVFDNLGLSDMDANDDLGGEDEYNPDAAGDDAPDLEASDDFGDEGEDEFALPEDGERRPEQREDQRRVTHTPKPLPKRSEVKADQKGNLLNAKGEIVAKAGAEARLYQGRQKAIKDLSTANETVADVTGRLEKAIGIGRGLHQQVQAFKAQEEKLKTFGFSSEDQIAAMQLFSEIRKDTAGTLKKLLTRAAARGITIDSAASPGGVDAKGMADAIKEILTAELKPLRDQQQQQTERERLIAERNQQVASIQTEISTFFRRNPDAEQYLPVFKKVMSDPKYADWSLGEIYARILRANPSRQSNGKPGPRSRTPQGRIPRGRGPDTRRPEQQMDSVNTSYDSILKDVMANAGY